MGMDQRVQFTADRAPSWLALRDLLSRRGLAPQLRMIDGQLAFPDEEPPPDWQELRVGTAPGMVTLRREPDGLRLVIWGNADPPMRQAWNALTWAVATISDGMVECAAGLRTADEFARSAELPGGFAGDVSS
jgi:hypothetical protein